MPDHALDDLTVWAANLPRWQQEALQRLLARSLGNADIDELADLAVAEAAGGCEGPTSPRDPPLERLPSDFPEVRLAAIREITHVNGLGPGPIEFEAMGLDVIYGENASGKSGIARVLKSIGYCRDARSPILPNVYEDDPREPASATIEYRVGNERASIRWVDGTEHSTPLQTVHVLDARSAANQVEQANPLPYKPVVLQVCHELAAAVQSVKQRIEHRISELGGPTPALEAQAVPPDTEAGRFVAGLTGAASLDQLARLCSVTAEEMQRAEELERALADDPLVRVREQTRRARSASELSQLTERCYSLLGSVGVERLLTLRRQQQLTREAADAARLVFSEGAVLDGVGSVAWRSLWEAARRYSNEQAYPDYSFPVTSAGSSCVLCQQPLDNQARLRLDSFEDFVTDEVQRRADDAEVEVTNALQAVRNLNIGSSSRATVAAAGIAGGPLDSQVRQFLVTAKLWCRYLLLPGTTDPPTELLPPPDLSEVAAAAFREAERLRSAADDSSRHDLVVEHRELRARMLLSPLQDAVTSEIRRLNRVSTLQVAVGTCDTRIITRKHGELAEAILSRPLQSCFQDNLRALGLFDDVVCVKRAPGRYGEHPFVVALDTHDHGVEPELVLSEGERTCVALAGLLAELHVIGNRSTLVLDDPVTSLDHRNRRRVAERLVDEARSRHVVILTHDLVFTSYLRRSSEEAGVPAHFLSLQRGARRNHAQVTVGLPWVALRVKERIACLRGELDAARDVLNGGNRSGYEHVARSIYGRLRETWERCVEEVLLNEVVTRFELPIQTRRLTHVVDVTPDDVAEVSRQMSRCSDFAHDAPAAASMGVPDPDVLLADIARLDDWARGVRRRRQG